MAISSPFEFFIQWHLTEKCNLSCRHCYQGGHAGDELLFSEIRKTAEEAADMIKEWSESYGIAFNPGMSITGGEPFLRADLFAVLREIKSSGFKVSLLTNGTLVNRESALMLADIGVESVQVSIEGPEDVHDAIRGPGSFAAAAAGVESLVACRLNVTLNVTLSTLNSGYIKKIADFGSNSGVRRVGFARLVPWGSGKQLLPLMLRRNELKEVYSAVQSLMPGNVEVVTNDPLAGQMGKTWSADAGSIAVSGCAAALSGLTIQANGDVLPCRRLPIKLGNVRKDSLRELWATSPVLEALRDRNKYTGKCGSCSQWALCRGCRAIAYAASREKGENDFLADDPQCFFEEAGNKLS